MTFLCFTQAQAQAMVQAAAQAQAVVAAAKNRGGGLVPMNAAQIAALSQIQAQAIVNARPQTALVGKSGEDDETPTTTQIQNQIQLQAQALVHAHTQAQITAGIYKGGDTAADEAAADTSDDKKPAAVKKSPSASQQDSSGHNTRKRKPAPQDPAASTKPSKKKATEETPSLPSLPVTAASASLKSPPEQQQPAAVAVASAQKKPPQQVTSAGTILPPLSSDFTDEGLEGGGVVLQPTSPEFIAQLNEILTEFWTRQLQEMHVIGTGKQETEQDFKNHNDLPLARIKRIMKSDEDVRMISAEAPVLFAKACEMFILDMSLRSFAYSTNHKRKTLTKEDVIEAIKMTDIFDFLVDVIN